MHSEVPVRRCCWWLILSRYDKQTNCSVPWAVCLSVSETDSGVQLNSPCLLLLSSDRQFKALASSSLPPPHTAHHLSHCVSLLPQRWARSVSLKRIRDISTSHRGRASPPTPPPSPFSLRDQVLWFGQIKTALMSVGTVSDYTVRPIVLVSLTNLPCWVGRLWGFCTGVGEFGGWCTRRFTVIELSLSSDPARR